MASFRRHERESTLRRVYKLTFCLMYVGQPSNAQSSLPYRAQAITIDDETNGDPSLELSGVSQTVLVATPKRTVVPPNDGLDDFWGESSADMTTVWRTGATRLIRR
jgi:hypothetical protein